MFAVNHRLLAIAAVVAFVTTACGQSNTVPPAGSAAGASSVARDVTHQVDTTSILKKLVKSVTIGTTVDPTNGDEGPRSLAQVTYSFGKLKKGDLLVCNFEDKSGTPGNGTTVELLPAAPGSKPTTFAQNSKIQGCDGVAVDESDNVWVSGLTSKQVCEFSDTGKLGKKSCYGGSIEDPLTLSYGAPPPGSGGLYSPYFIFVGDIGTAGSGNNGSMDNFSLGGYGTGKNLQAITGFATSKVNGWQTYGPSGLSYNCCINPKTTWGTLYIVDGVNNTLTEVYNAPNLLLKDEIVVESGGKSFKCLHKTDTCAKLLYSGSPLDAPVASAILPNGNLILANTQGSNELVEIDTAGKVLGTKVVDTGASPAVVGLWAIGKNDANTALFYTDINSNSVVELEQ